MRPIRRFKRLLTPVSFVEKTNAVLSFTRRIAEVNDAEITLLHVVPQQSYRLHQEIYRPEEAGGANVEHAEEVSRIRLEEIGRKHLGKLTWQAVVRRASNPATAILAVQEELASDLIVVTKSDAGELTARLPGGLHEKLIRSSPCAVWSASSLPQYASQESVRNVLAPVVFDAPSGAIARLAASIAEAQDGRVRLLHVLLTTPSFLELRRDVYGFDPAAPVDLGTAQKAAEERLERFAEEHVVGVPCKTSVAVGHDVATAVLEAEKAWRPDVVVMGTQGFSGFFHVVLGSAAENVARRSECSVVTLRLRS